MVLIECTLPVAATAAEIEHHISTGDGRWLGASAVEAYGDGERLVTKLGARVGSRVVAKEVELIVGRPHRYQGDTVIPLCWLATGFTPLFPRMDANLVLEDDGNGGCRLHLLGRYDPPLGPLGRAADRAALHKIAEATVDSLLQRIRAHVLGEAGRSATSAAPAT